MDFSEFNSGASSAMQHTGPYHDMSTALDPLDCMRNLAAMNVLPFQMMPQTPLHSYWPHPASLPPTHVTPFMPGFAPWIPPLPSPFLMGITCDGIPVKKSKKTTKQKTSLSGIAKKTQSNKNQDSSKSSAMCRFAPNDETTKSSSDTMDTGECPSVFSDFASLENSSSVQSADTGILGGSMDDSSLFLEDFDLFSSDFEAFLNDLTFESFAESNAISATSSVTFIHKKNVRIPQRKRSERRRSPSKNTRKKQQQRQLTPERLASFLRCIGE